MKRKWILFVLAPLALVAFVTLGGLIVQALWNWLLPPLFGWKTLTFLQALGLLALSRILFGGFGMGGSAGSRRGRGMAARCRNMTPEERETYRQGLRERWGFGREGDTTDGG